jgi:C1A family cysteine protease
MKKNSLIILLAFLSGSLFSQNIVTKVVGKIKKADGTAVRIGSKLSDKEALFFSSKNDLLRMIVSGKKTFIVSPGATAVKKENGWKQLLSQTNRIPVPATSLSGRSQVFEKIPAAFETLNKINQFTLISNSQPNKYVFNATDYDVSNGSRFIIQIEQDGKSVRQILHTSNDTLLLYRSDFQLDESKGSTPVNYTIGFYDKTKNQSNAVAEINPYFDDAGEMEAILHTLIIANKNKSKTVQKEVCYNEVYKTLGKPSDILFYTTFDKILNEINNPVVLNTSQEKGLTEDIASYERINEFTINATRDQIDLPAQFSLRQYAPQVQSQGHYGTCVAWSSAYAARTIAWSVKNNYNNIDSSAAISNHSFSPQFLFLSIRSENDTQCENGSTIVAALNYMRKNGVIAWDKSPYNCEAQYSESDKKNALNYKIQDFQRLCFWFNVNDESILNMKVALSQKKPLLIGMHVPKSFNKVDTKTGIWYPDPKDYDEVKQAKINTMQYSGHAMCVIGYNDAVNGGSFEIMNSWGNQSGKDGFYWISYDDMKQFASQVLIIEDTETP